MRIVLVNPNTSAATTAAMVAIAGESAAGRARVRGVTAPFGVPLITEPQALATATEAVLTLAPSLSDADAVIVSAFGDPGLDALRAALPCPVTGIAEAGSAGAGLGGRRFAVVTTTPALAGPIAASAARCGHAGFAGTWTTPGEPGVLTTDAGALTAALREACDRAVAEGGAEAVVRRTLARSIPQAATCP